jgi:hypothetical protein
MIDLYKISRQARVKAEQTDDPEKYELAAAYFEMAGLDLAAQRCRDRARLYHVHKLGCVRCTSTPAYADRNNV